MGFPLAGAPWADASDVGTQPPIRYVVSIPIAPTVLRTPIRTTRMLKNFVTPAPVAVIVGLPTQRFDDVADNVKHRLEAISKVHESLVHQTAALAPAAVNCCLGIVAPATATAHGAVGSVVWKLLLLGGRKYAGPCTASRPRTRGCPISSPAVRGPGLIPCSLHSALP